MPQFFILASRENKIAKKQNEMGKKGGQEKITQRTLYTNIIKKKGNNTNLHRITCFFQSVLQ